MIKIMPQALSRWLGAGNLSLDIYIYMRLMKAQWWGSDFKDIFLF